MSSVLCHILRSTSTLLVSMSGALKESRPAAFPSPCEDVWLRCFHPFIDLVRYESDFFNRRLLKDEFHPFCGKEGFILSDQSILRFLENPYEILCEREPSSPDGKPPLELRQKVCGLAHVKSAGRNKKNMIRFDHPYWWSPWNLQQWEASLAGLLHGTRRAILWAGTRNFVQFVQEDNPVLLCHSNSFFDDVIHINEFLGLFLKKDLHGLCNSTRLFFSWTGKCSQRLP